MKINFTYQGQKVTIDNISVGGYVEVEYTKSDGERMKYKLMITKKNVF